MLVLESMHLLPWATVDVSAASVLIFCFVLFLYLFLCVCLVRKEDRQMLHRSASFHLLFYFGRVWSGFCMMCFVPFPLLLLNVL